MAKLKVFISSTYYDLKHIRSTIEDFVEGMGYEAILSEKGSIAYNPDIPLDESCYRDAQACDIFVLIIGGRYGSAASSEKDKPTKEFLDRFESITKKEFDSALEKDIPVFILVEKGVFGEYETFKRNRKMKDIDYAHVDSINIFEFLDRILSKPRNNPVHQFDKHNDIIDWLKLQWSGLFKDFLQRRHEVNQISSLSEQVKYLAEFNTTLKRYLEEIMSVVNDTKNAKELISSESKRLEELKMDSVLREHPLIIDLLDSGIYTYEYIKEALVKSKSINQFVKLIASPNANKNHLIKSWENNDGWCMELNSARDILGLPNLKFEKINK